MLTISHLVEKFSAYFATRRFITSSTRTPPLVPVLSRISPVDALLPDFKIYYYVILPPTPRSWSGLFQSGLPTKTLYTPLLPPTRVTWSQSQIVNNPLLPPSPHASCVPDLSLILLYVASCGCLLNMSSVFEVPIIISQLKPEFLNARSCGGTVCYVQIRSREATWGPILCISVFRASNAKIECFEWPMGCDWRVTCQTNGVATFLDVPCV
jgi:hypothetical protein